MKKKLKKFMDTEKISYDAKDLSFDAEDYFMGLNK